MDQPSSTAVSTSVCVSVTHAISIEHDAYVALGQRIDRFMLNPFNPVCPSVCSVRQPLLCACAVPAQERSDGGGVGGKPKREKHSSYEQRANGQRGPALTGDQE